MGGFVSGRDAVTVGPYWRPNVEDDVDDDDGEDGRAAEGEEEDVSEKKRRLLSEPVGTPISDSDFSSPEEDEKISGDGYGDVAHDDDDDDDDYDCDVAIVGSGPESLFCAALLARSGRSVVVLCPDSDASGCLSVSSSAGAGAGAVVDVNVNGDVIANDDRWSNVPFDVDNCNVSHASRQQRLLSPALVTTEDAQGGVRFARVGTAQDGYAHTVLSIPGVGVGGGGGVGADGSGGGGSDSAPCLPFVLRAGGKESLANDAAAYLGDGWPSTSTGADGVAVTGTESSMSALYVSACESVNASSQDYYLSKVLSPRVTELRPRPGYQDAGSRDAQSFLNRFLPLNPHVRALLAGAGMKDEDLSPGSASMAAHVTNVCAAVGEEGMCYPIGGPRAICRALEGTVRQCGGRVLTGVSVESFLFETEEDDDGDDVESGDGDDDDKGDADVNVKPEKDRGGGAAGH